MPDGALVPRLLATRLPQSQRRVIKSAWRTETFGWLGSSLRVPWESLAAVCAVWKFLPLGCSPPCVWGELPVPHTHLPPERWPAAAEPPGRHLQEQQDGEGGQHPGFRVGRGCVAACGTRSRPQASHQEWPCLQIRWFPGIGESVPSLTVA